MKKIIGILLIGFLGFLGCSDGDDGTTTVGKANPVAPWAIIETSTPTYEWTPVAKATKYRLVVSESNQASTIQDTQETSIIDEWYTAEESGCASEDGLCMVTPDIEVFEEYTWKVQACANEECGVWSETLRYQLTPPASAGAPRFTDHGDGTVTDNNTKLLWTKNANPFGESLTWDEAMNHCYALEQAWYSDWRLPDLAELKSLIDTSQYYPALPPGHPFTNWQTWDYWTCLLEATDPGRAYLVNVADGDVGENMKTRPYYAWPVRSGN